MLLLIHRVLDGNDPLILLLGAGAQNDNAAHIIGVGLGIGRKILILRHDGKPILQFVSVCAGAHALYDVFVATF